MTDQSQQDRLAALTARTPKPKAAAAPAEPTATQEPASRAWRPKVPSATRVAATGASMVSFAAMMVAMGPLTATEAETAGAEPVVEDPFDAGGTPPTQPEVVIEVIPNYVSADGTPLTPEELAFVTNAAPTDPIGEAPQASDSATPASPDSQTQPATASSPAAPAAAPVTVAPATAAPAAAPTTAVPAAAPATAAPATAAPAPVTAAPTTAPPAPAPAETPPPRSDASG